MKGIEISVRHTHNGTLLNIHLDARAKQRLIAGLQSGRFDSRDTPINLELSVLPEWLTDPESTHARIPITVINVNEVD